MYDFQQGRQLNITTWDKTLSLIVFVFMLALVLSIFWLIFFYKLPYKKYKLQDGTVVECQVYRPQILGSAMDFSSCKDGLEYSSQVNVVKLN